MVIIDDGLYVSIQDTAQAGDTAVLGYTMAVSPHEEQEVILDMEVLEGTFVLQVVETVNGNERILSSATRTSGDVEGEGSINNHLLRMSIIPASSQITLRLSSPLIGSTTTNGLQPGDPGYVVMTCCHNAVKLKKVTVKVKYLDQEQISVTLCDSTADRYRFGYNGQEKVNEIAGIGNHNTAEFWEYDTRLGRRWNLDPEFKKMPFASPYTTNFNNPILILDPHGDFGIVGFFVGFAVDVGVQILGNKLSGKEAFDIDYADAILSGFVGAFSGGIGNLGKLSKSCTRLMNAAGIEGNISKASLKVMAVVSEEGIAASIDLNLSNKEGEYVDLKTVFMEGDNAKNANEAVGDFIWGSSMTVFKGGTKEISKVISTAKLNKEAKTLLRKFKQTAIGSKNHINYKARIDEIDGEMKIIEDISEVTNEAAGEIISENLKSELKFNNTKD
jgi:hypothetical protein